MLRQRPEIGRRHLLLLLLLLLPFLLMPAPALGENPVLLGVYPWGQTWTEVVGNINAIDAWIAPRRIALAGDFIDIEANPAVTVPTNLGAAWDSGRIPFVKLLPVRTSDQVARGDIDAAISAWGRSFAQWSQGGSKRAFLAPLPEMNGDWVPYYVRGNAVPVVQAWRRIRNLIRAELAAANVPQNAISWVFAPNGWSLPGDEFEHFYPGHDEVDVVSFSAYNWGGCTLGGQWLTFDDIFELDLLRMLAMAPGKPIFVAETAVIDRPFLTMGDRNQWFFDTYTRLAAFPRLRGIVYFDKILPTQPNLPNCPNPDFRLHLPGTNEWHGFKDAVADPASNFGYWAPTSPEVTNIVFAPAVPHVFADVHPIHPFAVEPGDVDYSPWIHTLAASGITTGCASSPPLFCPDGGVTRDQMAVFLLRGIHGSGYGPPAATGGVFVDVSTANPYAGWIEQLAAELITGGCGVSPPRYCPGEAVTRGQMAVFLLRAKYGSTYDPPAPTGIFTDVPVGHPFAKWIEQLAREGITGGCGGSNYCPDATITRQQMAVFLVRAFNL